MNDSHPQVNVVMPVYNGERYLAEAIQSVLNQTYKDWELLMIRLWVQRRVGGARQNV